MTKPSADRAEAHLPSIDVMRALAAVAVLAHHAYGAAYGWDFSSPSTPWATIRQSLTVTRVLAAPAMWGNAGVPIFFLLSGFCIHLSHLRRPGGFGVGRFYVRRFWRLYPAYAASLVILMAPAAWGPARVGNRNVLVHVVMLHNLVSPATFIGINPPYWSLAVECQYYLAYPVVVLWAGRFGLGRLVAVSSALSLGLAVWMDSVPTQLFRLLLPFGFFQWCLGAWLAKRLVDGRPPLVPAKVGVAVAMAAVAALSGFGGRLPWEWFAWALLGTAVLERWVRRGTVLAVRPVVWVGTVSYSLYLWHYWFVTTWAVPRHMGVDATFVLTMIGGGAASVAVAAASYYLVERPGVALGRLFAGRGFAQRIDPDDH